MLAAAISLAAVAGFAQAQPTGKFSEELFTSIQRDMICLCGCKSILKDCPHVNCDYAIPARKRIREMLDQGKSREEILAEFVKEKGEQALAAPKKEGFNILGYILPFIAILGAGYGVVLIALRWAGAGAKKEPSIEKSGEEQQPKPATGEAEGVGGEAAERLKKELEEFDS
ncbi:MAG: cytochrome c-type biogenesis protein CcmH [Nitrospinota bacterium]|nr:cytochrome c-type biogenesis protein CcmH [Nitrospinota bacterium]MDH5677835.1 cytochrome c-type biogenesis protein CcmH [Nitrospinota bacterium]MDH5756424.1 cytochrome c-type biogenesis protein CcmH [Nitrospinota bacterium]